MNFLDYLKNIRQYGKRAFTLEQVIADLNLSKNAALVAIHRLKEHGDIMSPAQGFYVIVPPEDQFQGSIPAQELVPLLMDHLKIDYYVSLLSGAQYHGASHQKPGSFQIIVNRRIKHPLEFRQVKIEAIYKKSFENILTQNVTVNTGYLKIATAELVVFDLLTYRNQSGGLNHIATVLSELVEVIDVIKLLELAQTVKSTAWLQRLGYILEQIDPMDVEKTQKIIKTLEHYLESKMSGFIPLASELPKAGYPRIKKWKIIVNTTVESDL